MLASLKPNGEIALTCRAPQNLLAAMELRGDRERRAPKRLVEELEPARAQREEREEPKKEYDPAQSPAGTPTTDPQASNIGPDPSQAHHSRTTQHNYSGGHPSPPPHLQKEQPPSEAVHEAAFQRAQNMSSGNPRDRGIDPRLRREFHFANRNSLEMIPFTGPDIYNTSNGPNNPIWMDNMRRFEEMGNMDEYELVAAEMATSDEDENPNVKDPLWPPPTAFWDDVPVRLRIEMINAASGDDTSTQPALLRLKLNRTQSNAAISEYNHDKEEIEEEAANIREHQRQMIDVLMNGPRAYSSSQGLQAIAAENLYKNVGRPEVALTRSDIDKAKTYMAWCRLDSAFLDDYFPPPRPPAPTASTTPNGTAAYPETEHEDTPPTHSESASQPIAVEEIVDFSTPPDPSTPVPPTLSNGAIPQISLTPVAQRHQTPPTLSPVPLRLETSARAQTGTTSPYFNRSSSCQSTSSTIAVDVDGKGPLQGMRSALHAANRNLKNGFAPPGTQGPSHSQSYPSYPSNGNVVHHHHPNPQSDLSPPPKRQKPNPPKENSPATIPSNEISETAQPTSNGNQDHGTNGAATPRKGPLPYKNYANQSPFMGPGNSAGGPVQQIASSMTEEREQWAQRNGYGGERSNGMGNGFAVQIGNRNGNGNGLIGLGNGDVMIGGIYGDGSAVDGNGMANANGKGNGIANGNANGHGNANGYGHGNAVDGNGVGSAVNGSTAKGNGNGHHADPIPAKKKAGRPRKPKA
ncbi:MAG: hypothetical protein Q9226_008110 [Calogaya cf. arnoldii]